MRKYEAVASRILEGGTGNTSELKRAELYAYMDRTEAMSAEPVVKVEKPDNVWIIFERVGGGPWTVNQVFIDEVKALLEYENLSRQASTTSGYWEIDCKEFEVS